MKNVFLGILMVVMAPSLGLAQSNNYSRGHGYVFLAPGGRLTSSAGSRATLTLGAGGEWFFTRHAGVGGDAAVVGSFQEGGNTTFEETWGSFASDLVCRFRARDRKTRTEPFLAIGGTLLRDGISSRGGMNFGGGVNHWFNNHAGLRFELRDSLINHFHYAEIRIGITFR